VRVKEFEPQRRGDAEMRRGKKQLLAFSLCASAVQLSPTFELWLAFLEECGDTFLFVLGREADRK
jgi:hypothetical protein